MTSIPVGGLGQRRERTGVVRPSDDAPRPEHEANRSHDTMLAAGRGLDEIVGDGNSFLWQ